MTPEGKVKAHLFRRVKALGGDINNVTWIGRNNCPDTFIMFDLGLSFWVETKGPKKNARAAQLREHERMRRRGKTVLVLDTIEKVDQWINQIT